MEVRVKETYLVFVEGFEKDRAEAIYEKRFGEKPREAQEEFR